jgi:excisionase family DNA binding protein
MEKSTEILTVKEASEFLYGTPKKTAALYTKVARKQVPFRKVGGHLRFLRSELEQHVKQSPGLTLEELQKKQ